MSFANEFLGFIFIFLASILFAGDSILIKYAAVDDPFVVAAVRSVGAGLGMIVFYRVFYRLRTDFKFLFACSCWAGANLLFVCSLLYIEIGVALLLFFSSMIWAVIVKRLLGEKTSKVDLVTILSIFTGLAIFLLSSYFTVDYRGLICGLGAGLCFGFTLAYLEYLSLKEGSGLGPFVQGFIYTQTILVAVCGMVAFTKGASIPTIESSVLLLIGGVFFHGLGYCLVFRALNKLPIPLVSAYVGATEPIIATILAYFVLQEEMEAMALVGMLVVVTTICGKGYVLWSRERKERRLI